MLETQRESRQTAHLQIVLLPRVMLSGVSHSEQLTLKIFYFLV